MLYQFFEWNHAALAPLRAVADATKLICQNPLNPFAQTYTGRTIAAMAELFERTTRVYGKPEWRLHETVVGGQRIPVIDKVVWEKPFCRLIHFERALPKKHGRDPKFLLVAPMSGHYATLLRGTVDALLPYGEVYITDWVDARTVPVAKGRFDLDDYVDYLIEIHHHLGPDVHVVGVCQPAVPVLMAVARMEAEADAAVPASMTLMGGPIDTRVNPTAVNRLALEKGIDWFRNNVIMKVPFPQPGFMRDVYPGFLQLTGFMSMNLDRHMNAHRDFFFHLVKDDGDGADKHREFYDEYLAVMDLTAEFYLQTVEKVFIEHALPRGTMTHRGKPVDLTAIKRVALLTIEGENDDISGVGQTEAAQHLCSSIPADKKVHYVQPKVGHYGVFNGSRFRAEICPRMVDFALTHGTTHSAAALPKKRGPAAAPAREGAVASREEKAPTLSVEAAVVDAAVKQDAAPAVEPAVAPAPVSQPTTAAPTSFLRKTPVLKSTAGTAAAIPAAPVPGLVKHKVKPDDDTPAPAAKKSKPFVRKPEQGGFAASPALAGAILHETPEEGGPGKAAAKGRIAAKAGGAVKFGAAGKATSEPAPRRPRGGAASRKADDSSS
ncbi:polyhydroxyalkanoate depolymerase [Aurantimonas sp. MSK8Z-1]|uniref:polyhydroxyalkanoate depolymerase n=1 Tax=Mangrovibrevibacter kandeliae TaxID=2968473 RepID=UPI002117B4CD|nr:polyhydroxyalkanoate depolymerase [Aurantimonas sp. MSK8Z-1]MCW4115115.1 polyhydroxyalkanoate depolymerase [Aurantimonas sp. MSK8Z-1]